MSNTVIGYIEHTVDWKFVKVLNNFSKILRNDWTGCKKTVSLPIKQYSLFLKCINVISHTTIFKGNKKLTFLQWIQKLECIFFTEEIWPSTRRQRSTGKEAPAPPANLLVRLRREGLPSTTGGYTDSTVSVTLLSVQTWRFTLSGVGRYIFHIDCH